MSFQKIYLPSIAVLLLLIACSTTSNTSNGLPIYKEGNVLFNEGAYLDSSISYLGTFEFIEEKRTLFKTEEEQLNLLNRYTEGSETVYDIFSRAYQREFEIPYDQTSSIGYNTDFRNEVHRIIRIYQYIDDFKAFPQSPNFLTDGSIDLQTRFGIVNLVTNSSSSRAIYAGGSTPVGSSTTHSSEFTSIVFDFEKNKIAAVYAYDEDFFFNNNTIELVFEALTNSFKNNIYISPISVSVISDWNKTVRIILRDGGLYYGKIKYLGDYRVEIESGSYKTEHSLGEIATVVDDFSGTQLYPVVIESN